MRGASQDEIDFPRTTTSQVNWKNILISLATWNFGIRLIPSSGQLSSIFGRLIRDLELRGGRRN